MSAIDVRLTPRGSLLFAPAAHLGDRWGAYCDAVRALRRVDKPAKGHGTRDVEVAASAVAALQAAGFAVRAEAGALARLREGADALARRAAGAVEGVERARGRLAERGGAFRGDFQAEGVEFLGGRRSALLLDDMGLGKTAQVVLAAPLGARIVVACPSSVAGAWAAEVARWSELRPRVLKQGEEFTWPEPGEVLITSHDRLPPCRKVALERLRDFRDACVRWLARCLAGHGVPRPPALRACFSAPPPPKGARVVLDEVHAFKSTKSERGRNAKTLVRDVVKTGGSAVGLSGTPLQNRASELRAVLEVLGLFKEAFGSPRRFAEAFGGEEAVDSPDARATPAVAEALARVSLRRTKAEVLTDLPLKVVDEVWIPLEGRAAELAARMDEVARRVVEAEVARSQKRAGRALTPKEHEAALQAAIDAASEVGEISVARKVIADAVLASAEVQSEIAACEAAGEPIVVAATHAGPVAALGGRPGWVRIAGDVPAKQRTRAVEAFQAGRAPGVGVSIRAGGTGLTLTRSNRMLMLGRDWNPAQNVQMEDRIHRIGQQRPCRVTYFAGDCWIERRVADLCASKRALADDALAPLAGRGPAPVAIPDLSLVRVLGAEPPRQAQQEALGTVTTTPAGDGWLTVDDALRGRLERLAASGSTLGRWLLEMLAEHGRIPGRCAPRGQPKRPTLDLVAEAEACVGAPSGS